MFQAQSFIFFFSENRVVFQQKVLHFSNGVFAQFLKVQFIKCSKADLIKIITRM